MRTTKTTASTNRTLFPAALFAATCAAMVVPTQQAGAGMFAHESRSSELFVDPLNLGYNMGDGLGQAAFDAPPISLTSTVIDSSADLGFAGNLFYGPDFFDRVNSGSYSAFQDYTATSAVLGGVLTQSSDIPVHEASPLIDLDNTLEQIFTVSEDIEALLDLVFIGDSTNVGSREHVSLQIRAIDAGGNNIGAPVFSLSTEVLLSGGTIDPLGDSIFTTVSLDAGQRYRLTATGAARSIADQGAHSSELGFTLTVPAPGSLGLFAFGGAALIRRRR